MDIINSVYNRLTYKRSEDALFRRHRKRARTRLILALLILFIVVVLPLEVLPFIVYRQFWWAPLPSWIAYHLLVSLWFPMGLYIGLQRYKSATIPPNISNGLLQFGSKESYHLASVQDITLSEDKKWVRLEFDLKLVKAPKRLTIALGGILVPDADRFFTILTNAWTYARGLQNRKIPEMNE